MEDRKPLQIILFAIVFVVALMTWNYILVGRDNQSVRERSQASLPLLSLVCDGENINELHGYKGTIDAGVMRDTITPLYENQLELKAGADASEVETVGYRLYNADNKSVLEKGDIAFKNQGDERVAHLKFTKRLESGKTYLLEFDLSHDGDNIKYYTRVVYGTQFHLKECLDFADQFHDATLEEGKAEFVARYMETKEGTVSNDLSEVDLKSTQEAVRYAGMNPQVERMYPPEVKEISQNVTAIELRFILSTEDSEGVKQYYQANEYYRVRYSKSRVYLLNYERTMESYMRYDAVDKANNRLLLGIANSNKQLLSANGGKQVSFVAENELWNYDYQNERMYKVFSFVGEDYRDERSNYSQHGIRIMNLQKNGDMTFVVYGYMNRGEHEGENGISVYRFSEERQRIQEVAFIPTTELYETMEDDLSKGVYLSDDDQFYFYLDHTIYHVDLDKEESQVLAKNIDDDMAAISDNGRVAINNGGNRIQLIDSTTGKKETITCNDDEILKPIGFIENDFVYGIGQKNRATQQRDGSYLYPLDSVYIRSGGKIIEEYHNNGQYITDAQTDGNTVAITWSRAHGSRYTKINTKHIRYKEKNENKAIFEFGYSSTKLNQLYLSFPENVYVQTKPTYFSTNVEENSGNLDVKFTDSARKYRNAYVYTGGKLSGVYTNLKDAIQQAKRGGGVVVGYGQAYLWEKGITKSYGKVANIPMIKAKNKADSANACVAMMARSQGEESTKAQIEKTKGNVYDKLYKVFDKQAVNYSECKLEDVLYSVSKGRPVIVRRSDGTYILLISYNQTKLRYLDPVKGKSVQGDRKSLEREFKSAGSLYYSYAM